MVDSAETVAAVGAEVVEIVGAAGRGSIDMRQAWSEEVAAERIVDMGLGSGTL